MKKIQTIFERDPDTRSRVVDKPHPDCGWVFAGEGTATIKVDGTCCLVRGDRLFKRRELRQGDKTPVDFEGVGFDVETGKTVGWVPVGDGPEDRWHREAFAELTRTDRPPYPQGTYELLGPKIQGNPEKMCDHVLVPHAYIEAVHDAPRTFLGLAEWLQGRDIEGIVFHHPDGRMGKIKGRDFGLKRAK